MTDAIPIRNIYYMLAYADHCLDQRDFSGLDAEPFDNACDLFAAILARGLSGQIRRGLERSYVPRRETLSSPRGRIDISASIKEQSLSRLRLHCRYDEYSEAVSYTHLDVYKRQAITIWSMEESRRPTASPSQSGT